MSADITPFLNLITSEHRDKPDFVAFVSLLVQPLADTKAVVESFPRAFDLDYAVGVQLDAVGKWIGQSRTVLIPLGNVYFSFDSAQLGFDHGIWKGPFDPDEGAVQLDDETYRMVLRAKIGANHWDGSIPQMYQILDAILAPFGVQVVVQDYDDMSFLVGIIGNTILPPLIMSLLTHGFFDLKPAGVRIQGYFFPSVLGTPFFGFDMDNDSIAGFDKGSWATTNTPLSPGTISWDVGADWDTTLYFWG